MEDEQSLFQKMKRLFSSDKEEAEHVEEEIISMVHEGREQGYFDENEVEMIRNIFEFADKDARDIMTHRKNMIVIDGDEKLEDALLFILEQKYSRFPVYEEDINNITGVIHLRDVMKCYMQQDLRKVAVKELPLLNREVTFIPETKSIDSLFKNMQAEKNHLAVVIDEYGQTKGLVAMEDILEEIVGNILDEYDEEEEWIVHQTDDSYLVKGFASLAELEHILFIPFEHEDYDTLNGFLVSKLDRILTADDCVAVKYEGYIFQVMNVENNTIDTVRICKAEGDQDYLVIEKKE